jgi:hypothetical protein
MSYIPPNREDLPGNTPWTQAWASLADLASPPRASRDPDPPYESWPEQRFAEAVRAIRPGIRSVEDVLCPQYTVHAGGKTFRFDFAFPLLKVAFEIDGYAHHSSPADISYDRWRERMIEGLAGWRIIRFGAAEIVRDAEVCAEIAMQFLGIEAARQFNLAFQPRFPHQDPPAIAA